MSSDEILIEQLRREIDAIDDRIHDLLMPRTELVARVGRAKGRQPFYMRPAREAQILRRLAARHSGSLPFAVVARIWREIIGASTQVEGAFSVAVAPGPLLHDLARDHFGTVTALRDAASAAAAAIAVARGTATAAVVPWPDPSDLSPWWIARPPGSAVTPRVVQALPFVQSRGAAPVPLALVLAPVMPEPTGDDVALLAAARPHGRGGPALVDALAAAGLTGAAAIGDGLARVGTFVAPDDPRLGRAADALGAPVTCLGVFATQLEL